MDIGLKATEILLPKTDDMTAWSVIACDQFTSEKEYWDKLAKEVAGKPTVLDMILPEIYLNGDYSGLVEKINRTMEKRIKEGFFKTLDKGFVLTVRSTPFVKRRIGIIGALDLEKYDYKPGSRTPIRATEGTIEERIPPRLKIREKAPVEFPHIMVLFDDEKREIAEKLYEKRDALEKLYDFTLNMGGGKIEGYFIKDYQSVLSAFNGLADEKRLTEKYGKADNFIFAVGDGNHSLATAKAHWEKVKSALSIEEREIHPARYALVELVNIYDEGIYFEPIFRFVNGVNAKEFTQGFAGVDAGKIRVYADGKYSKKDGKATLPEGIAATDRYIKDYIAKNGGTVDYVHGESNLQKLVDGDKNSVGILFEKLDKADLFKYVSNKGAFPRKTFSMGENIEKRYYLEGRKIK